MVVVCHAYNLTNLEIEHSKSFSYYIQYLFGLELSQIFIPMFFFISGYLFFNNHDFTRKTFKRKIKNRFKTLMIPYLLWCGIWFLIIYSIQYIPMFSHFFDEPLHEMSIWQQLWRAFVDPINYTFWFIRELIFYVLVSPLIYLAIKYLRFYFLIFLLALLFLQQPSLIKMNNVLLFQFLGVFSFSLGAYFSIEKIKIVTSYKWYVYLLLMLTWSIFIFLSFYTREVFDNTYWVSILVKRIAIFLGFFAVWALYDFLDKKNNFKNYPIYSYRFFIYAAHGVAITYLTKIYVKMIGEHELILLLMFFISPIVISLICIAFANLLQKSTPKIYGYLTGSR
tara:strand:- start:1772 stop:2782 length:1011 start_codon:yes stop_codon:yes gene_type:complete